MTPDNNEKLKVIAEWMGGVLCKHPGGMGNMGYEFKEFVPIGMQHLTPPFWWAEDQLKFGRSYDWAMPVWHEVRPILKESIAIPAGGPFVEAMTRRVDCVRALADGSVQDLTNSLYSAIVFIKSIK